MKVSANNRGIILYSKQSTQDIGILFSFLFPHYIFLLIIHWKTGVHVILS